MAMSSYLPFIFFAVLLVVVLIFMRLLRTPRITIGDASFFDSGVRSATGVGSTAGGLSSAHTTCGLVVHSCGGSVGAGLVGGSVDLLLLGSTFSCFLQLLVVRWSSRSAGLSA